MAIPKQSNCVCEKPRTAFAGNTDCPSLKSSAKHPPVRYGWMRKTASLPATMSTVPMCGRQWSSAEPPTINTINTVSADTYAVITGIMTQNAITIKADGGKNGAGDTFQCGHSNEQRLCNQYDRAWCGNAGIEWHKYSEKQYRRCRYSEDEYRLARYSG